MKRALLISLLLAGCGGANAPAPIPEPAPSPAPPPPPPVTCTHTLSWTLTEDRADLTHGTLYAWMVPLAPESELEFVQQVDAYVLMWVLNDVPAGHWYYRLTVSVGDNESDYSNEVDKECS